MAGCRTRCSGLFTVDIRRLRQVYIDLIMLITLAGQSGAVFAQFPWFDDNVAGVLAPFELIEWSCRAKPRPFFTRGDSAPP